MPHWLDELAKRAAGKDAEKRTDGLRNARPGPAPVGNAPSPYGAASRSHITRREGLKTALGSAFVVASGIAIGPLRPLSIFGASADYASCFKACMTEEEEKILKLWQECVKFGNSPVRAGPGPTNPWHKVSTAFGCDVGEQIERHDARKKCEAQCCKAEYGRGVCQDVCVDLQTDNDNCGSCGHVCVGPSRCINGHCSCNTCGDGGKNPYSRICGGQCTDTSSDFYNCGSCGNVCPDSVNGFAGICNCGQCDGCAGGLGSIFCCQTGKCAHACPSPGETCP